MAMEHSLKENDASRGIEPGLTPIFTSVPDADEEVCCGPPAGPPSSPFEKPGYKVLGFVDGFRKTTSGPVPKVKTRRSLRDIVGTIAVRIGIARNNYKIAPGLYCIGNPDKTSPVMVTANYKLSFDTLRRHLEGVDTWLLVLDTRGINVWCAAGKGIFSTEELIRQIKRTRLDEIVSHRNIILPQLSATGVIALRVKKETGFSVIWGPIRAEDIKRFSENGMKADKNMRLVTFSFIERMVLIPVEMTMAIKPAFWIVLGVFIISGIGPGIFSLSGSLNRGLIAGTALISGILAGGVMAPLLMPWLPFRAFSMKGTITGVVAGLAIVFFLMENLPFVSAASVVLMTTAVSSFLAMNFTGATPFTSPSGVEKEMRRAIPLQGLAFVTGIIAWAAAGFTA